MLLSCAYINTNYTTSFRFLEKKYKVYKNNKLYRLLLIFVVWAIFHFSMNIYIVLIEYPKLKYNHLFNSNNYIDTLLPVVAVVATPVTMCFLNTHAQKCSHSTALVYNYNHIVWNFLYFSPLLIAHKYSHFKNLIPS